MLKTLWKHSVNKSTYKTRKESTPMSDNRTMISQIDICYSVEYYNHKVKTFWGGKKAYTYPIKRKDLYLWIEFMEQINDMDDDEIRKS